MSTILIVDDLENNRYLLRVMLAESGFEVLEAANGAEGLELARRTRPDLIVSDILMPQMDGFAMCRECKRDEQLRDIPLVFCTATYTDPRDEALALQLGAARFIVKPIEEESFIAILREILNNNPKEQLSALPPLPEEETVFYRLYNEALIRKLEDKMLDLEQLNNRLVESEKHFRRLAENAPDLIYRYEFTPRRGFTYVSPATVAITGYTSEEYYADPDLDYKLVHPDDRHLLKAAREVNKVVQPLVLRWMHKNGEIIWVEQHDVPVVNEEGQLIAIEGIARDITLRKQHEHELEVLAAVSAALRVAQTPAQMLPIILDQLLSLMEVDGAALVMPDQVSGEWRTVLGRGVWAPFTGETIPPGAGLTKQNWTADLNYLNRDSRIKSQLFHPDAFSQNLCISSAPLVVQGQMIGLLWIGKARPLTDHELHLLSAIADITANAIHRAAMHEETTHRVEQLQALQTIDRAITTSFDLRMTLNVLLEQCVSQLNVDAAEVLLLDPHQQTLNQVTGKGFHSRNSPIAHVRLGENFAGRAALERRILHVDDINQIKETPQFAAFWASEGFADYYSLPLIVKGQVKGVLEVFHRAPLAAGPDWINFLETLGGQAAIAIDSAQLFEDLQRSNMDLSLAYEATIEGWSRALDLRDRETEGHTLRVAELTVQLARARGINEAEIVHIRRGALLHDIGKMGVPDSILLKPDKLTNEEWVTMRKHPTYAYEMLSPIAYLSPALEIPYCHHEEWEGRGYPRGLKGEQIPLSARLFAVVDVWDALRSDRPYRRGWPEEKVLEHIRQLAGSHFDPKAVELFFQVMDERTQT